MSISPFIYIYMYRTKAEPTQNRYWSSQYRYQDAQNRYSHKTGTRFAQNRYWTSQYRYQDAQNRYSHRTGTRFAQNRFWDTSKAQYRYWDVSPHFPNRNSHSTGTQLPVPVLKSQYRYWDVSLQVPNPNSHNTGFGSYSTGTGRAEKQAKWNCTVPVLGVQNRYCACTVPVLVRTIPVLDTQNLHLLLPPTSPLNPLPPCSCTYCVGGGSVSCKGALPSCMNIGELSMFPHNGNAANPALQPQRPSACMPAPQPQAWSSNYPERYPNLAGLRES